jgi:glycerol kinase
VRETTALGAAIAAGFAIGIWQHFDDLKQINRDGRTYFQPQISQQKADAMYRRWNKAVHMSRGWSEAEDEKEKEEIEGDKEGGD